MPRPVNPPKILIVFGTRPEAIKLAPVIRELRSGFQVCTCSTGQHRDILRQVLDVFDLRPEYDLDVMQPGQTLFQSTARILSALEQVLDAERPDMVVVQGDTTTTFCGALAAFYAGISVGHVEAGLRTHDMRQPFPEEMNRVLATRLTSLHFAATSRGADALAAEGITTGVFVTGNTGIDALLSVRDRLAAGTLNSALSLPLNLEKRLVVVTTHRRENFGAGLERICAAILGLAARPDVQIVVPVHPNPQVRSVVLNMLGATENVVLIEPLDYVEFVDLMRRSYILLTDSGGVQEEAPSLGKPVLVLRDKTERPEAVESGTARLVGTDTNLIVGETARLLDDFVEYAHRAQVNNPYGDGQASKRIAAAMAEYFQV